MKASEVAAIYDVSPRQARRWLKRGLPVDSPTDLARALAFQRNGGKTLLRLTAAARMERTLDELNQTAEPWL